MDNDIGVSEEFKNTPEVKSLMKKHAEIRMQRKLFKKCVFSFGREVESVAQCAL